MKKNNIRGYLLPIMIQSLLFFESLLLYSVVDNQLVKLDRSSKRQFCNIVVIENKADLAYR